MDTQPTIAWRTIVKRRLAVAAALLLLWSAVIEARLVYLQVVRRADLTARADDQHSNTTPAPAERGELLDRHGKVLAFSVDADSIYAVPSKIDNVNGAAAALCKALGDCTAADRKALAERIRPRKGRSFAWVRRQVSPQQAGRVSALGLEAVGFVKESRRFYPNKELASHLLGYVGIDSDGLGGIEARYDSLIKGRPGTILIQTDARGHAFSRVERPPTAGASLELTIDQQLQYIVERELRAGVAASGASGGSATIIDPTTGEILAMASYPTFNPNAYGEFREEFRRNRAVQDLYEPGSTFKIVTASAAIEEHVIAPSDRVDVSGGAIRFGSRVINDTHNYGVLSFEDVIVKSSNVGAIKVGLKVGAERLGEYIERFGFGRTLSPDFHGESAGIVWDPAKLNDSALASVSMGYQVGVTPLQMASAVSVIANGGELIEPRLVRAVVRDGTRVTVPRTVLGRAISPRTAAELTTIMEAVVERGTATAAQVQGHPVAGKTGTASKVVNGRYSRTDYNVSFAGFVPSRKPMFTITVVIDSPRTVSAFGGVVAAPIFKRIAEEALRHYGVPSSIDPPPPVLVERRVDIQELPAASAGRHQVVVGAISTRNATVVPDLRGLGARDALRVLAELGIAAELRGTGVVVGQRPEAGSPISSGAAGTLWLGREPSSSGRP